MLRICRLDHLCVCARKVYCGKTADWIRIPFGVMSGVGLGMGVWVVIVEGEEAVWVEFGAFHCNQWDRCDALFSNYFEDLLQFIYRKIMP